MGRSKKASGEIEGFRIGAVVPVEALGPILKILYESAYGGSIDVNPAFRHRLEPGAPALDGHVTGPKLLPAPTPPPKPYTLKPDGMSAFVLNYLYRVFPETATREQIRQAAASHFTEMGPGSADQSMTLLVGRGLVTHPALGVSVITEAGIAQAKRMMMSATADEINAKQREQPPKPDMPPKPRTANKSKSGRNSREIAIDFFREHPRSRPRDLKPAFAADGLSPHGTDAVVHKLRVERVITKNTEDGTYSLSATPRPTGKSSGKKTKTEK